MRLFAPFRKRDRSPWLPEYRAKTVFDIDFSALYTQGVQHIIFDMDQTLRHIGTKTLSPKVVELLRNLEADQRFKTVSIMSNDAWAARYLQNVNITLFTPYWRGIHLVRKPSQRFFGKVLETLEARPEAVVIVGDKLRADIYGGNLAGMHTVWVEPVGRDYLYDRVLGTRRNEQRILKKAGQA